MISEDDVKAGLQKDEDRRKLYETKKTDMNKVQIILGPNVRDMTSRYEPASVNRLSYIILGCNILVETTAREISRPMYRSMVCKPPRDVT